MTKDRKRYEVPKPSSGDKYFSLTKAGISAIPTFGGPASELFAAIVTPPLEKRRIEWMERIGESLYQLEQKLGIDINSLQDNPQFIDLLMKATQIALRSSQKEKVEALRNAILNSAIKIELDDVINEIFLNLLDNLTPVHINLLMHFLGKGTCTSPQLDHFATWHPILKDQPLLYGIVWKDLIGRELLESRVHGEKQKIIEAKITELGKKLLRFISDPLSENETEK
jgi:hypothetical protein